MIKGRLLVMSLCARLGACYLSLAALALANGCGSQDFADERGIGSNKSIVERRADPWIWKTEEDRYHFIGTAPKFNFIEIRSAYTINGLKDAEAKVAWRKHEEGPLKTQRDYFSLDATTFEHRGKRYLIWGQKDAANKHNSALYISEMATPTTLTGPEVMFTEPELLWEVIDYRANEGAAVMKRHGRIFVTYSASATDHNYAMGLWWADEDADLLILLLGTSLSSLCSRQSRRESLRAGHNSFTVAEDGKMDVLVYHARDYKELQGSPLTDPNRDARARILRWTEEGFSDLQQTLAE